MKEEGELQALMVTVLVLIVLCLKFILKKNTPIVSGISHNISFRFVLFNSIK